MRTDPRPAVLNHLACLAGLAALGTLAACTPTMSEQVTKSIGVLSTVQDSKTAIEPDVLRNAKGVAILEEGQWGLALAHMSGRGLLLKRLAGGQWSPPCAIKTGSLTIGLSAGGQGRDVVIVFETEEALDAFVADGGYFLARADGTFGDASGGTAEPVAKENRVRAYTVASGVWASAALGGMSFSMDKDVNDATYGPGVSPWDILDGKVKAPEGQTALAGRIDRIAQSKPATAGAAAPAGEKTEATPSEANLGAQQTTKKVPVEPGCPTQPPDVVR